MYIKIKPECINKYKKIYSDINENTVYTVYKVSWNGENISLKFPIIYVNVNDVIFIQNENLIKENLVENSKFIDFLIKKLNDKFNCKIDYCRCDQVIDTKINSVSIQDLLKELNVSFASIIDLYCISRLLIIHKLYDSSNWEFNIHKGYYGKEVHGTLLTIIKDQLINNLKNLEKLSNLDKIKYLIKLEYGYLLPSIECTNNFEIKEIELSEIKLFNQNYMSKLDYKIVSSYDNYELPRAICMKNNGQYCVIDGYHRMVSAFNLKKNKVLIIELKEQVNNDN